MNKKNNYTDKLLLTYLNEIKRYPLLNIEKTKEYFLNIKNKKNIKKNKNKLIVSNLGLVINVAKRYNHITEYLTLSDLIGEGNFGLIKAVDKFDLGFNVLFSTYATWWIKHYIERSTVVSKNMVRRPFKINELAGKFIRFKNKLQNNLKREPTIDELAEYSGVQKDKLSDLLDINKSTVQIPFSLIYDDNKINKKINNERFIKIINNILKEKSDRDKFIIKKRLGISDNNELENSWTLEQIGRETGLTRERIRQILTKEIKLLKKEGKKFK